MATDFGLLGNARRMSLLTQEDMAHRIGVTPQTLCRIEQDPRRMKLGLFVRYYSHLNESARAEVRNGLGQWLAEAEEDGRSAIEVDR